jgi:uncharacterized protein
VSEIESAAVEARRVARHDAFRRRRDVGVGRARRDAQDRPRRALARDARKSRCHRRLRGDLNDRCAGSDVCRARRRHERERQNRYREQQPQAANEVLAARAHPGKLAAPGGNATPAGAVPAMHPSLDRVAHRPWALPSAPWRWRQSWRDLLFAHWPVPASELRRFVPDALSIQEFDGTSWVGVVPFRMAGVAPRHLPDVPGLSAFPELNLRLYVEAEGKPGVWFVSLDAASPLAVWAARRAFHLPYFLADMRVASEGERVVYQSIRRDPTPRVAFRGSYAPASAVRHAPAGGIEHFLTERYCLYTRAADGGLLRAEVHHGQWPLQDALLELDENAIAQPQGIALAGPPALLHFSRRIDVVGWLPERVTCST